MWNLKDAPAFFLAFGAATYLLCILPLCLRRRWFRFAKDTWDSREGSAVMMLHKRIPDWLLYVLIFDKIQHFLGGLAMGLVSPKWSLIFWFAWEIKDGHLPFEKFGVIGGDGFSWKDTLAAWVGVALAVGFKQISIVYVP